MQPRVSYRCTHDSIDGDIAVLAAFADKATIDSPLCGHQQPPEFVAETRAWLSAHGRTSKTGERIVTPERVVHEFALCVSVDGTDKELPVMLVADIDAEAHIRDLRIYHSTWPLTGSHRVRSPLMQYTLATRPPEPVGSYHDALAAGDAAAADAVFESAGSVREPAGVDFTTRATIGASGTGRSSRMARSRCGSAPSPTTARPSCTSTRSSGGARRESRRRPGPPPTSEAQVADSVREDIRRRSPLEQLAAQRMGDWPGASGAPVRAIAWFLTA